MAKAVIECPHCKQECERTPLTRISPNRDPSVRKKVQDLSLFRWKCPNCGTTMLVEDPCLYHDISGQFMVWLSPEGKKPETGRIDPLAGYTLRYVDDLNAFREKINILERGLDDRAVEIMKLILFLQLQHDLDVVELLFHDLDERTAEFRFAAVLSDGAEQYVAMPGETYQRIRQDVEERLYTPRDFVKIDMSWAADALELLRAG